LTHSFRRACRVAAIVLVGLSTPIFAQQTAPAKPGHPATLQDLFSELSIVDAAISTSGRYLAVILRRDADDVLLVVDLTTSERKAIQKVGFEDAGRGLLMQMATVYWKSDERLLLRTRVQPKDALNFHTVSGAKISKLGDRLFAIDRASGKAVALLGDNRNSALDGAFDLGAIMSFLPRDPQHILMVIDGFNGRSLFKVDIDSGKGEQMERPSESVVGWWLASTATRSCA
jgi:hypothetical protein